MNINLEAVKQWILVTLVPVITGGIVTWLAGSKVLNLLHLTSSVAASTISSVIVFGVTAAFSFLASHHILAGHYSPAAKSVAQARKTLGE
jgi:predicted Na+-dependent transporter